MLQLARDKKHLGVKAGMLALLHTWGQNLMYHPHLHCLVPAGGLSPDGETWVNSSQKFFLPVKILSRLFRGKFLEVVKQAFAQGKLKCLGNLSWIDTDQRLNAFLRPIYQQEWVVYAKEPFGGLDQVIGYLGRYTHRVAIANERIINVKNDQLSFRYKDYRDHNSEKVLTVDTQEFIRRFLLHILPHGFHKIRYYGILANKNRKTDLRTARKAIGQTPAKPLSKLTFLQYCKQYLGKDFLICPACKKGKMIPIQIIPPISRAPPIPTHKKQSCLTSA
ncbi:MAG: transposase [Bacteroidia bacterium]